MSEATATPATSATNAAPPATDTNQTATTEGQTNASGAAEELFEVQSGKDNQGKPITKKLTRAQLLEAAARAETAQARMEEARGERAKLAALAKALKDPEKIWDVLKALGHNDDELITKRAQQALEDLRLTPEQRQGKIDRAELDSFRKQDAARKKAEQEARERSTTAQLAQQITNAIDTALTGAKLANNPNNRSAVAAVLETVAKMKGEDGKYLYPTLESVPMDKVVSILRNSRISGVHELAEGADDDALLEWLGDTFSKRVAKAYGKKLVKKHPSLETSVRSDDTPAKQPKRAQTTAELMAEMNGRR